MFKQKVTIDTDTKEFQERVDHAVESNEKYKKFREQYEQAFESLEGKLSITEVESLENAVIAKETVACDITYKKAFHDSMRFILNAMAGGEVIEI